MSRNIVIRTEKEVDDVLERIEESYETGTNFPASSYEDGLKEMYEWLMGLSDDAPCK